MIDAVVHLHNGTTHKAGTPEYPSEKAAFIYHMACGIQAETGKDDSRVGFTDRVSYAPSYKPEEVTCKACIKLIPEVQRKQSLYNEDYGKPPEEQHKHKFVIPVEWEYIQGQWDTEEASERYQRFKRATKLMCECGQEQDR